MYFVSSSYQSLPGLPGVYQFLDENNNVLYVGKAKNLKKRVSSYFVNQKLLGQKTLALVSQIKQIKVTVVESELESLLLEAEYIKKFLPKYNIRLTDGKAYPLIRITIHDEYPKVLTARSIDDPKSLYFGPYPSSTAVKMVLKTMRRIFPFQAVVNHPNRVCLYNHLNLCPCPPVFNSEQFKKDYKKNINHLVKFLEGNTKNVIKDLEKERDRFSEDEEFEKAQNVQKQIDSIKYVTSPIHAPFEYDTNPNLREDKRSKEINSLREQLQLHGITVDQLQRIECYDMSNFQGTNPVGSMVVLTNGEIDKSQYRKFKIRNVKGPNDFASMAEVIARRLKHTEWELPDLIMVDGGKGQISSAVNVVLESGIPIPVIGLAKREEILITSEFKEIKLPKSSPALLLVQRIRDEAHRFAITFHRKLRSKATFE